MYWKFLLIYPREFIQYHFYKGCDSLHHQSATKYVRRYNHYTSIWNLNCIHLRNPWVTAWWSAAFPGFGHIHLGLYMKGFILFFWEIIINTQSKLNLAMVYSFTGRIEQAKEVLDIRLLIVYIPVYIFCIWDSYRLTVDLNKHYYLAKREKAPIVLFTMNEWGVNMITKREPKLALLWSVLFPGLGSFYIHRFPSGFFAIAWSATIIYFSHFLIAIQHTFMGEFQQAAQVLDEEWSLFLPSIFCFAIYEAYILSVEYNKLFKIEQKQFLEKNYQQTKNILLNSKDREP